MPRRDLSHASDVVLWIFRAALGLAEASPVWSGGDVTAFRSLLTYHRGWALFARHGRAVAGVPASVLAESVTERQQVVRRQLVAEADLRLIAEALDRADVPWLLVKGPVLAQLYQRRGNVRAFSDLDVLVAPTRLADALAALSAVGGQLLSRNYHLMRQELPGEVAVVGRHGTVVDLHWSLVNRSAKRSRTRIPTSRLLAAATRRDLGGPVVPVLSEEEALVHVCLHAALAGATRLVWLLDVALSTDNDRLNWERVVDTARDWGVGLAVGLVLMRSNMLLGAPVPASVVESLTRPGWRWAETAGRATPARLAADLHGWPAHIASGALQHRTVNALALDRLRRRLLAPRRGHSFVQGDENPGSTLYPAGDMSDLAAYLHAVAQQTD